MRERLLNYPILIIEGDDDEFTNIKENVIS